MVCILGMVCLFGVFFNSHLWTSYIFLFLMKWVKPRTKTGQKWHIDEEVQEILNLMSLENLNASLIGTLFVCYVYKLLVIFLFVILIPIFKTFTVCQN